MRARLRAAGEWLTRAVSAVYRDVLVFGGAGVVAWGLSGYDGRLAMLWAGGFAIWMGLGAPGIRRQ